MSDPSPAPSGGGSKMTPAQLWGFLLGAGIGGGIAIVVFLVCLAAGIDAIGAAKRRYPEVVLGMITLGLIGALMASGKK